MGFLTPPPLLKIISSRRIACSSRRHQFFAQTPQPQPSASIDVTTMQSSILSLRRQKLSFLLSDLIFRVRTECAIPPHSILSSLDSLISQLSVCQDDSTIRAAIRQKLWELRQKLSESHVSQWLRQSLETARTCALDIPRREDENVVRQNLLLLMTDNMLLEELSSLRQLERQLQKLVDKYHPRMVEPAQRMVEEASADLGVDEYRVRGKKKLVDALETLKNELQSITTVHKDVRLANDNLVCQLMTTLETDLTMRSPAGEAMLLRPRMHDIPNFDLVSPVFLRGGQPTGDGLNWLRMYGVALVIDLRGSDRENQWSLPTHDRVSIDGSEMRSCNFPIEDFHTPTVEQVYQFIELVNNTVGSQKVIFVHCKAGIGRTGTMIACWRISNGIPVDEALAKERLYTEGGGGLRQEKFVRDFACNFEYN